MIWFFKKKDKDKKNDKAKETSGDVKTSEEAQTSEDASDVRAEPDLDHAIPEPEIIPSGQAAGVFHQPSDILPEEREEEVAPQLAANGYEAAQHYGDLPPAHALDTQLEPISDAGLQKKNLEDDLPADQDDDLETAEDSEMPDPQKEEGADEKKSWLSRLTSGLAKSSSKMTESITSVITKKKLDDETLEELEEALIVGDLGPSTAARLTGDLAKTRFGKDITYEEVRTALADGITDILAPVAQPLQIGEGHPHVILFAGVNGTGKTTTIGKLAKRFTDEGKTVMLAAGDTFRAAAVEQLKVWGERTGCQVVAKDIGADAGALAYEAMESAKQAGVDVLLVDTAGRLQNKSNLMDELQKVVRVIQKHDENAPHQTLLVLDATTGQNAHSQVELFDKAVDVTGLIVTKLDGTAKGGVIVSLADKYKKPIHAIGVGESVHDLHAFKADDFARSLMGL